MAERPRSGGAARVPTASAAVGALLWAAATAARGPDAFLGLDALFLVLPLVVVPLALGLLRVEDRSGGTSVLWRAAALLQPAAALAVLASFALPAGGVAAALALPWLALAGVLALWGVARFLPRTLGPAEELVADAGLLFLPVGAAWLVASRAGLAPLGFGESVVLLTAVHFHAAAFALPALVSLLGRALRPTGAARRAYAAVALGVVAGPPLLAVGITISPALELAAAVILAAGAVGYAALALARLVPRWRAPLAARALLAASAAALLVSMGAAVLYAVGEATGEPLVALGAMVRVHGAVNAYAVLLPGLLAFALAPPPSRGPRPGMPASRLASRGRTGPDFFDRIGAVAPRPAAGLVDDLREHARPGFDPARVHPAVRAFYERTQDHALVVVPAWRRGFRGLGRVYRRYARRAGQMALPLDAGGDGLLVRSRVVALRDEADGRVDVRAWVRTYAATGDPVYVAAYATHREAGQAYMNIAFPFPGWNLTSVLLMDALGAEGAGIVLTTRATGSTSGDQGVYLVRGRLRVRLPMDETIRVWPAGAAGAPFTRLPGGAREATVVARHEIWLLGRLVLTLDYHIFPVTATAPAGDGRA